MDLGCEAVVVLEADPLEGADAGLLRHLAGMDLDAGGGGDVGHADHGNESLEVDGPEGSEVHNDLNAKQHWNGQGREQRWATRYPPGHTILSGFNG